MDTPSKFNLYDYPEILFGVGLAAGVLVGAYFGRRWLIAEIKMLGALRKAEEAKGRVVPTDPGKLL